MERPQDEYRASLPDFPLPDGFTSDADYLKHLVLKGADLWWHPKPSVDVLCRLHRELDFICRGYPRYFLIMHDLVTAARDRLIPFSLNRGAQCGSAVLYALGLTATDPTKRGLPFEMFINPDFAEHWLPDIDVMTDEDGLKWAHSYLVKKYGITHVARISGYKRGIVLTGQDIRDVVPTTTDPGTGFITTACSVKDVLMANLVKFDFDTTSEHPIVEECLRETNGVLVYREQLAEIIHLLSGQSLAWSLWTLKNLAVKKIDICETRARIFFNDCLSNPSFRIGRWADEAVARKYLQGLWDFWYKTANRLVMYTHVACADPVFRTPTKRKVIGEVSLQDIATALQRGERVAIVMRHAERPSLPQNDPTFGKELPITANGRRQADAFGFALFEFCRGFDTLVCAGESVRCEQTALAISKHVDDAVTKLDFLGSSTPFFGDVNERMALANAGNYRESLNAYFKIGVQRGFNSLRESTDAFERHLWEDGSEQLGVYVTHDLNVACFLAGRGVIPQFEDYNWPRYLDAAVAFLGKYGHARYGYMRSLESKFSFDC